MSEPRPGPPERARRSGPGRILITLYAVFAVAATSRAGFQIATRFSAAPVAYLLSAFAAVVYILASVMLTRSGRLSHRVAVISCSVELAGVLVVGTYSVFDRPAFPDATVWSGYGLGYGFVPLVLPVLGLLWLRRTARASGIAITP
jgi:cytochrome bd-type quinol oxidase subunit 2